MRMATDSAAQRTESSKWCGGNMAGSWIHSPSCGRRPRRRPSRRPPSEPTPQSAGRTQGPGASTQFSLNHSYHQRVYIHVLKTVVGGLARFVRGVCRGDLTYEAAHPYTKVSISHSRQGDEGEYLLVSA